MPDLIIDDERSTMEILEEALDRLRCEDNEWIFSRWTRCTCGHIYSAAEGLPRDESPLGPMPSAYAARPDHEWDQFHELERKIQTATDGAIYNRVIEEVAIALGWKHVPENDYDSEPGVKRGQDFRTAPVYVSDFTVDVSDKRYERHEGTLGVQREDAIAVIEQALDELREDERERMEAAKG